MARTSARIPLLAEDADDMDVGGFRIFRSSGPYLSWRCALRFHVEK